MIDDAGITKDGNHIDTTVPFQQKGHAIWQLFKQCNASFSIIRYPNGFPGSQMKIVLDADNLKLIKLNLPTNKM